jgi:predicted TIM-barrel fold metal-dependent hydrolase
MSQMTRRGWLAGMMGAGAALGGHRAEAVQTQVSKAPPPVPPAAKPKDTLLLSDYQPKSMLVVPQTSVPKARFPVIDVHTHPTFRKKNEAGVPLGEDMGLRHPVDEVLAIMDRRNLKMIVDLTGGVGTGLATSIGALQQPHPDRFAVFTEPTYDKVADPGYAQWQADELSRAKTAGARGLKILKVLGLYLREQVTKGPLIKIDDPRFDPMWEACGGLGLPVAIHISDPRAFFTPIDRFNERYEELQAHPAWSFYGKDFPTDADLIAARDRMLARHPKTTFVGLHIGHSSEDLAAASASLDRFPNLCVETAARFAELGRQPRASRKFFERYQDRILFGTDGVDDSIYPMAFRFLETEDEYFEYSAGPVPGQGRWRIYGIGLPDEILKKVYSENATRLLKL